MSNTARIAATAANTLTKPLNIEEVFSTYLLDGSGTITNGIDLAGEGGLLWTKWRSGGALSFYQNHFLYDTERGYGSTDYLHSNNTDAAGATGAIGSGSFNSDGFTTGGNVFSGNEWASWTFRKAPKFFDVVTYTGDNSANRQIAHNLGQKPGMIIIKSTDLARDWQVYHRSLNTTSGEYLELNQTAAVQTTTNVFNSTEPTDTHFTVGSNITVNGDTYGYVAYLFAHNDGDGEFGPTGDQDIIKCGSYTGNGSATGPEINLGFEPQWLLFKDTTNANDWIIIDNMRGMVVDNDLANADAYLRPNLANQEGASTFVEPTPTGFKVQNNGWTNVSGANIIYIAIRRGPMAVPESATDVFAIDTKNSSGDNTDPTWDLGIVTDMAIQKFNKTTSTTPLITSRLTGTNYLLTSETSAETSNSGMQYDYMTGVGAGNGSTTDVNDIVWGWKRAPNYFDAVAYTGDGTNGRAISHNLGVAPEMMWVRVRNAANDWVVYHKDLGENTILRLNSSSATISKNVFSSNTPTDSVFYVQGSAGYDVNYSSSQTYIAYLFASLPGISKVGSYTGNGTSQTIDCGFSSGARFVIIKRTDAIGNWLVVDTERGLVSGNDPVLLLDATNAEQTNLDIVDPTSSGFIVNGTSANWNASGGTYIFYAIA